MTAREVTGFRAFSPARKSGKFLHILGGFLAKLHRRPGEKGKKKTTGEKNLRNPVETAPRNCRFLSLVVVERVLSNWILIDSDMNIKECNCNRSVMATCRIVME